MLERLPYFRLHVADYLLDTRELTLEEHGIYCLLMFNYYWSGSIPAERQSIEALIGIRTEAQGELLDRVLSKFFKIEGDVIVHRRIDRELEKMKAFFNKQHSAAAASVAARAEKPREKKKINGAAFNLPDWIERGTWDSWVAIRPAKARTNASLSAAIKKLDGFKKQGMDPNSIISNSLANGWQGLFAIDKARSQHGSEIQRDSTGKTKLVV